MIDKIVDQNIDTQLSEGISHFLEKITPLLKLNRLDNIVDILSLLSDLVDIIDNSTIEKISNSFEDILVPVWEVINAFNMSKMELSYIDKKYNLRTVFSLLKDPDTLKGISIILRTLQIMAQRTQKTSE
ncbi:hypothetical protein [Moellerella wisconsensis]|uniref:DUF1641 domain-containing protein n=1 Tax=Moellerella wisconsensis ATCC 35017 TaxID=1354267 RepID=A0A0N0ZD21_9GAMM|nr:hypothetical protein [Moellerella wisconsensis]KPD04526.1 hypothetical protein M992_0025 [Moellerella wisconsensis ATCC 35017]VFS54555.1 Uncharacterised protein [Moellerella wisconsensis]